MDLFIANKVMLFAEEITPKLFITSAHPKSDIGNVFGASIPMILSRESIKINKSKIRIMSCSFGEGFSWAFSDFTIEKKKLFENIEIDSYFEDGSITHEM